MDPMPAPDQLQITYPAQLPVSARKDDIAAAIRDHQVVIVAGETGSGKTTQIPKICLELGRGVDGRIGHTQPRRIAARSVAERIAEELGTSLGGIVGYQVRFTQQVSRDTRVAVMTDGILLAQIQRDPLLRVYDTLIIDEAHERSLNIDFLLGYLTTLLPQRPDLKLIITSATIDSERFARHFAPGGPVPDDAAEDAPRAPVIEVTGRTYPVEIRYRPLGGEAREDDTDLVSGVVDACDELMGEGDGDVLVFLSGEREIRDVADALRGHLGARVTDPRSPRAVEILPLFSRLSAAEQHRVFESHAARRIVLATNVAETSLTVPGIHYVVDPGLARISRYSKATKVQRLPIEPISQASARQRSGRAGRLADGIAIRLYAEEDFEGRPAFTEPEILRTSLASVLLRMIAVGVVSSPEEVGTFPFVEAPDTRAIRDGLGLLTELGAITTGRNGRTRLTDAGRAIATLPIDPREARMVVEGARHGVAHEVAVIAAALSIQDPRERPSEQREAADQLHRRFADPGSDLLAYLNLWEYLRERRKALSNSQFRRMCKSEHLHFLRIREWQDLVQQLRDTAKDVDIRMPAHHPRLVDAEPEAPAPGAPPKAGALRRVWDADAIHRSVLAGLLSQLGMQDNVSPKASDFSHLRGERLQAALKKARRRASNEYLGSRGARFAINPGSPLSKKPPAFVMAAELVETSRLWARDVAGIDPSWAEELAGDLAKRSYAEPHWSAKRGAAMATERVTLYGVPLVTDRQVLWGRIDAAEAREMFIRHALVQGEWRTHHRFWKDNQRVIAEAEELSARTRDTTLVADEDALFDFYDDRLPDSVISTRHFDRWWKGARAQDPDLLTLSLDTVAPGHEDIDASAFPTTWPQGDLELPLTYQFEPGTDADGVTVHIPLPVLPRVVPEGFDWLVPGLAEELAIATIRALPKAVRRLLVPAPDAARDIHAWLDAETPAWADMARAGDMAQPYRDAFTAAARAARGVEIPAGAWDEVDERLPAHLKVTFRAEDERGRAVDESTDLLRLQRTLASQTADAVRGAVAMPGPRRRGKGRDGGPGSDGQAAAASETGASAAAAASGLAEQSGLSTWPELPAAAGAAPGTLPETVTGSVGGAQVRGYPAIVAEESGPALRILADLREAERRHPEGVRALLARDCGLATGRVTSRWSPQDTLTLAASPYPSTDALVSAITLAAVGALTTGDHDASTVRTADDYARVRAHVRAGLEDRILAVSVATATALAAARELDAAVSRTSSLALIGVATEIRAHAESLVGGDFLARTPLSRLDDLPRYLTADLTRLEKAAQAPSRDAASAFQVSQAEDMVRTVREAAAKGRPDAEALQRLEHARWLLEEFRVSLFAQSLGTSEPVSAKRIRALLS